MITYKNKLSKKEYSEILTSLEDLTDLFGDFYITKENFRYAIKDNPEMLIEYLNKGDKIAFCENGLALVLGYSDNAPRKYLKILAKDDKTVLDLLKVLFWNVKDEIYIKIKKNNPIRKIIEKLKSGDKKNPNLFSFVGSRGKEILFVRKATTND